MAPDELEDCLETVGLDERSLERIVDEALEFVVERGERVTLLDLDELRGVEISSLGELLGRTGETEGLAEFERDEDDDEERERE